MFRNCASPIHTRILFARSLTVSVWKLREESSFLLSCFNSDNLPTTPEVASVFMENQMEVTRNKVKNIPICFNRTIKHTDMIHNCADNHPGVKEHKWELSDKTKRHNQPLYQRTRWLTLILEGIQEVTGHSCQCLH